LRACSTEHAFPTLTSSPPRREGIPTVGGWVSCFTASRLPERTLDSERTGRLVASGAHVRVHVLDLARAPPAVFPSRRPMLPHGSVLVHWAVPRTVIADLISSGHGVLLGTSLPGQALVSCLLTISQKSTLSTMVLMSRRPY